MSQPAAPSAEPAFAPNAEAIMVWNEIVGPKFTRFRHLVVPMAAQHGERALALLGDLSGLRVLDVGCGFGDSTIALGQAVGPTGAVRGLDCTRSFLEIARADLAAAGLTNVDFVEADAQTAPFEPIYDLVFSRFGSMFFANPVAAMRNLATALKPGGRLLMVVWRALEENEFMALAKTIARKHIPPPEEAIVTCGPGPFSMADPEVVTAVLAAAGYTAVRLERMDLDARIAPTVDEALMVATAIGPAGEIVRAAGAEGERVRPAIEAELRAAYARMQRPDGVYAGSSTWAVLAEKPA